MSAIRVQHEDIACCWLLPMHARIGQRQSCCGHHKNEARYGDSEWTLDPGPGFRTPGLGLEC